MCREIDILARALDSNCALVEKETHCLWTEQEVERASDSQQFQQEDALLAPDNQIAVTSLFPGCPQQYGAMPKTMYYAPIGQTAHFVVFRSAD